MYTNIAGVVPICIVCRLPPAASSSTKTTSLADYQCTCSGDESATEDPAEYQYAYSASPTTSGEYLCSFSASPTSPGEFLSAFSPTPTNAGEYISGYSASPTNSGEFVRAYSPTTTVKQGEYQRTFTRSKSSGYEFTPATSNSEIYQYTYAGSTNKLQLTYSGSKSPKIGYQRSYGAPKSTKIAVQRSYSAPRSAIGLRCTFSDVTPSISSPSMEVCPPSTIYTRRLSRRLSTSPAGGAIDNKIEQAMDLVKSHLLFAVREEVEVLKEQIKVLVEKNEVLQEENSTLKQRLQQQPKPALQQQQQNINMPNQQQQQQQQHGISMSSQEQPTYTGMPNQLGQTISDHAAYPQHPRATQQAHSTPNPGGLPEATPQYTPQGGIDSQQGQYQGMHSQQQQQRHIGAGQAQGQPPQTHLSQGGMQERSQYSQVAATQPSAQPQQMQGQYQTTMAQGGRQNANH